MFPDYYCVKGDSITIISSNKGGYCFTVDDCIYSFDAFGKIIFDDLDEAWGVVDAIRREEEKELNK